MTTSAFPAPVVIDEYQLALARLKAGSISNAYLEMPPGKNFDVAKIFNDLSPFLCFKSEILALVLFGSSVRYKREVTEKKGLFGKRQVSRIVQTDGITPEDVDLFVLLAPGSAPKRLSYDLSYTYWSGSSPMADTLYRSHTIQKKGLDVFASDYKHFEQDYSRAGDSIALSIIRDGVLLAGSFPMKLCGPMNIVWKDSFLHYVMKEANEAKI